MNFVIIAATSGAEAGSRLALALSMESAREKSTEEQNEKITVIKGSESLGYEGAGREEHSGETKADEPSSLTDDLADNSPADL
jgi:hypothetical protein